MLRNEPGVTRLVAAETIALVHVDESGIQTICDLRHELLAGFTPTIPMPGANSITVNDGWVYISNTRQALLLRSCYDVQLDPAGVRTTLAGGVQGIVGSTSAAIGPRHPGGLLVTTTGGMQGPGNPAMNRRNWCACTLI